MVKSRKQKPAHKANRQLLSSSPGLSSDTLKPACVQREGEEFSIILPRPWEALQIPSPFPVTRAAETTERELAVYRVPE